MAEIKIENMSYAYRKGAYALNGITADIGPGIHLLLGPNGAGKTTLMQAMSGNLVPQAGEVKIDGINISERTPEGLEKVFYLPDDCHFPLNTIGEMAERHAPFYPNFSREQLEANLREFGMSADDRLAAMSLGWRKKACISYALALNTDVLLLDEPANGLDIQSKKSLNKVLASNCGEGKIIVVATHTVHEMQALFDGLMFIHRGSMPLVADVYELGRKYAFVSSAQPIEDAVYSEPAMNGYRGIIPNDGTMESQIDFVLLYQALIEGGAIKV
ncbi:MAG: ABC transporter ATP-binding protein [Clostridium sp.]|nr:ABC transporter ATP-binding protein [Clostridium sp.]